MVETIFQYHSHKLLGSAGAEMSPYQLHCNKTPKIMWGAWLDAQLCELVVMQLSSLWESKLDHLDDQVVDVPNMCRSRRHHGWCGHPSSELGFLTLIKKMLLDWTASSTQLRSHTPITVPKKLHVHGWVWLRKRVCCAFALDRILCVVGFQYQLKLKVRWSRRA